MTPKSIEKLLFNSEGHVCGRIVRRSDGSIITAEDSTRSPLISGAAVAMLGAAIPFSAAAQQLSPQTSTAIVTGTVKAPKGKSLLSPAQIVFVANQKVVLEAVTDITGNWKAELAPGTYDVIFRNGPLFGERVNSVHLHAGEQSFSGIEERFAYGHLGTTEDLEQTVTMGEIIATYRYPISYLFKHPFRYLKNLRHNLG